MRGADAAAADRVLRQPVEQCPVTIANGNGPPGEGSSPDDHGNGVLWTALPPGGIDNGGTPDDESDDVFTGPEIVDYAGLFEGRDLCEDMHSALD